MTRGLPTLGVTLGLWQDRPSVESVLVAEHADRFGYDSVWVGEMATYDAFALATAVAHRTSRVPLVVGPLAVAVRDPMMIAMGAASVAELTGRRVDVAIGTSSELVVEAWHGRPRQRSATALRESAAALRPLLDGQKSAHPGQVTGSVGYRLRAAPPRSRLAMAAFGPRAIAVAAAHADVMVLNLVDPATVSDLVGMLEAECARLGRERPRVALWVSAAGAGDDAALQQLRTGLVGYLGAAGYSDMFERAGFGEVVERARAGAHPRELLAAIPDALIDGIALVGDAAPERAAAYRAAGVDDLIVVPACTDADPAAERLLGALAGSLR